MKKMTIPSRIVIAFASLMLVATYFVPVWFIFLIAPQYPEGLTMNIWLDKITGQVEIINGLNHYIGMKHISSDMFPELEYMIYIVGALIALGLLVAIIGKRSVLLAYNILLIAVGIAAMYDFYLWSYDYGHNLDPKAAIQIPGLSYQPPLFGHKTLLNFDAYSYPDTGGWIVIVAAVLFIGVWVYEFIRLRKAKKQTVKTQRKVGVAAIAATLMLASCSSGPQPFQYGKDACEDCRMTIMEAKFAAQIVTNKGRVFKFDDAHCLANYLNKNSGVKIARTVFNDFLAPDKFVDASAAYFVKSDQLKSPMNGNVAAFASKPEADKIATEKSGNIVTWEQIKTQLVK